MYNYVHVYTSGVSSLMLEVHMFIPYLQSLRYMMYNLICMYTHRSCVSSWMLDAYVFIEITPDVRPVVAVYTSVRFLPRVCSHVHF